jgi:phenylpropionate dioxygenase-like ring-hydroxylating dioxygenase large terminal subunit
MFISKSHLPHLLAPERYCSAEQHQREQETLFRPAWHMVGTKADMPHPGDFLTLDLFGYPLLVRNCDGRYHTFLNVCAHRHCTLTDLACGNSPTLRCQYHGWEYDSTGNTRKIPDAKSFKPLEQGMLGLRRYRTATAGQLVFMTFDDAAPDLPDYLGPAALEIIETRCSDDWRQMVVHEEEIAANWKIPVENSLESYHIAFVHGKYFAEFPEEEICGHELHERATIFRTSERHKQNSVTRAEKFFVGCSGRTTNHDYFHLHMYPNLLLFGTDLTLMVQTLRPTSPSTHRNVSRLFGYRGHPRGLVRRYFTWLGAYLGIRFWTRVLAQDRVLFPAIQSGLSPTDHPGAGLIATREERIFHFQEYILRMCGAPPAEANQLLEREVTSLANWEADTPATSES